MMDSKSQLILQLMFYVPVIVAAIGGAMMLWQAVFCLAQGAWLRLATLIMMPICAAAVAFGVSMVVLVLLMTNGFDAAGGFVLYYGTFAVCLVVFGIAGVICSRRAKKQSEAAD